jgi:hypothetical protein
MHSVMATKMAIHGNAGIRRDLSWMAASRAVTGVREKLFQLLLAVSTA